MNKISFSTLIAFAIVASFPTSCTAFNVKEIFKRSPAACLTLACAAASSQLSHEIKQHQQFLTAINDPNSNTKTSAKYRFLVDKFKCRFPGVSNENIDSMILNEQQRDLKIAKTILVVSVGLAGLFGYLTYNPTNYTLIRKFPGLVATGLWIRETLETRSIKSAFLALLFGYATYLS